MIGIMKILLDADILLEAVLDRNMFIDEIEKLFEVFTLNKIEIFISELGLSRINSTMKIFNTSRKMTGVFFKVKKPLKKLKVTEAIAQKAKVLAVNDFESAVEISLAIEENIGAIITHKPDDFLGGKFNIITLTDFQQRHKMEISASGDTNELLARWTIPLEKLFNLNKILDRSPSYTDIKSLEPKESTSQLDLTCSSDKVSTASTDKLSSQSTPARPLKEIIADSLSNRSAFGRSTASTDVQQYNTLATAHLAHEKHLDDLRTSMSRAEVLNDSNNW
jgi:predicted nucleic acid-binding protein